MDSVAAQNSSLLPQEPLRSAEAATPVPAARRFYRPELDLLRCFAFLMVFAHHTIPPSIQKSGFHLATLASEGGAAGVCLFFLLSAFLITELLLRERETTGTIHLKAFYVRRILRIWPLYFLIIGFAILLPHVFSSLHNPGFSTVAAFLLLAGNWSTVVQGWPHSALMGPLWSISVEEQFYLVWPAMVRRGGTRAIFWASSLVIPVGWLMDFTIHTFHGSNQPKLWCNSLNQFQFFALGGLLALWLHHRKFSLKPPLRLLILATGLGLFTLACFPFHFLEPGHSAPGLQTLASYFCLDGAALCTFCAFLGASLPRIAKPLIYLGKISYGLYVFHLAIMFMVERVLLKRVRLEPAHPVATAFVLTMVLTILVAMASYHFFEKPFLRFKEKFTFVPSRAA
jgi:peptidoglycan/LPS O-acetylase OafA/YrhL